VQAAGFRLGIDFGTSHTVAVLRWPDGRAKPLLFDGSPLLPSAVYLDEAGRFVVGRDALDSARTHPSRLEPNPKRRIDDGSVLLGDRDLPVAELIAAVLRRVAEEAARTAGERPEVVTLTCPAAWGTPRRRVLLVAAEWAGLGEVRLVEEPVAAATYFARLVGGGVAVGTAVVVYDLGGGTFDVSLVERTTGGFRTVAVGGRDDIGGLDLDEALVRRIGQLYAPQDPAGWQRLAEPVTRHDRRLRQLFREDVRNVKERLSRHNTADLHIPGLERDAHVTREEFEALARPLLDETVRLTVDIASRTGFPRERIAGVFLVGGASRIPLVATLVHRGLGMAPTVIEQPELVVAEGSLLVQSVVAITGGAAPARDQAQGAGRAAFPVSPAAFPVSPAAVPVSPAAFPVSPAAFPVSPAPVYEFAEPRRSRWAGWSKPSWRWGVAGLALALVAALVVVMVVKRSGGRTGPIPVACSLARTASGTPEPARSPGPVAQNPYPLWRRYVDKTGFQVDVPEHWPDPKRYGTGVCFTDPDGGRYLSVAQWRQSDDNLVAFWTRMDGSVGRDLAGYQKLEIKPQPYNRARADWEFTFDDGGRSWHARAFAVLPETGNRAYGVFWVTWESAWNNSFADFTRVVGAFNPAQPR
jgi:Hsp70 protein